MKRLCIILLLLSAAISFAFAQTEKESEKAGLVVSRIVMCENVKEREPLAVDSVFFNVKSLCCYTVIRGAANPTYVQHVWYYGKKEMARIKLNVRAARWRTYSSKRIIPQWTGDWRIEILDADNKKISQISFKIK